MNTQDQPFFCCRQISKSYDDFSLKEIGFSLEPGYLLGVVGKNGSGKSTLVQCLLGGTDFDGDAVLNGISLKKDPKAYKNLVGYVLHEGAFPPALTADAIGEYYGRYYEHFDFSQYRNRLSDFEIPARIRLHKLSNGQQIRQQLAFALSYGAKLLIMDEPNANLDVPFRTGFYGLLQELLQKEDCSVIYVSHLVDEIERYADFLLWIQNGSRRYFGTVDELRDSAWDQKGSYPSLKEIIHRESEVTP